MPAGLEADITITATGLAAEIVSMISRLRAEGIWLTITDTAASRPTRLPFPGTGSRCEGARAFTGLAMLRLKKNIGAR